MTRFLLDISGPPNATQGPTLVDALRGLGARVTARSQDAQGRSSSFVVDVDEEVDPAELLDRCAADWHGYANVSPI